MVSLIAATDGVSDDVALAAIIVLGVAAMWVGSRLRIPSILLLLGAGVAAGPGLDLIDPDALLGDLLFPAVSLAVGIILFEAGLGLRLRELEPGSRLPILRLVTIGVLVTWVTGAVAAFLLLDISRRDAALLGSILVVSGPTVVLPLLRFIRPREPVSSILRWEGIFIDPIGATLAIVVLDAVIDAQETGTSLVRIASTTGAGVGAGVLGAAVLILLLRNHWIPDHLHNPFTLMMVVGAFAGADVVRPEAGLFATTVMGVILANQRFVAIAHIREFEENLGSLILAGLFIVLGAAIDLDTVEEYLLPSIALVAVLVLLARPLAVYLSTVGSGLTFRERAFLASLAPRGIVAAAVSALFALELEEAGQPFEELVPVTFVVIVGTVVIYSITARVAVTGLQVAQPRARGIALIGGPRWALEVGETLSRLEVPVLVVTTDENEAAEASERGMLVYSGRIDAEEFEEALEAVGVAQAVALSRFTELNAYGITRLVDVLGRANVFYLPPTATGDDGGTTVSEVLARRPFSKASTQETIERTLDHGGELVLLGHDEHQTVAEGTDDPEAMALVVIDEQGAPSVTLNGRTAAPPPDGAVLMLRSPRGPEAATPGVDGAVAGQDSAGSSPA